MDLVKLIADKVKEVEASGKLEEIIENNVLECLKSIVSDSFRWNGEAKKSIEEALKGKLGVELENVKIPQYQKLVGDILSDTLNKTVVSDLEVVIKEAVNNITEVLEKKQWKLSEIISMFTDNIDRSYDGEMEDQYGECTLHVKKDGDFVHVKFDKESDREYFRCDNSLFIYKNKLSSATIEEKPFTPFGVRTMNNFEMFMFKLYCSNVDIILDENECELNYCREDCD